jgi:hypothetical protein
MARNYPALPQHPPSRTSFVAILVLDLIRWPSKRSGRLIHKISLSNASRRHVPAVFQALQLSDQCEAVVSSVTVTTRDRALP